MPGPLLDSSADPAYVPACGAGRSLITALLLLACAQTTAAGQAPAENGGRPTIAAMRLADGESVALDGRLDEPVWSRAMPGGNFAQIDPDNGRPAASIPARARSSSRT